MSDFVIWPHRLLVPTAIQPNLAPFSRSGGTTLGGLQRVTRTDRGWWSIAYTRVTLAGAERRRAWNAMRSHASGMAGLFAVPVWSHDSVPWQVGSAEGLLLSAHDDDTTYDDGAEHTQESITVETVGDVAIGATSMVLRIVDGIADLTGVRFSYRHALYETGLAIEVDGDEWTVEVSPAVRATIPAGAELEFAMPTCLVRLASDRGMDAGFTAGHFDQSDVAFVEAVDYWNDLANI